MGPNCGNGVSLLSVSLLGFRMTEAISLSWIVCVVVDVVLLGDEDAKSILVFSSTDEDRLISVAGFGELTIVDLIHMKNVTNLLLIELPDDYSILAPRFFRTINYLSEATSFFCTSVLLIGKLLDDDVISFSLLAELFEMVLMR